MGNIQWVHRDLNCMKLDHSQVKFINWCRLVCEWQQSHGPSSFTEAHEMSHRNSGAVGRTREVLTSRIGESFGYEPVPVEKIDGSPLSETEKKLAGVRAAVKANDKVVRG